MKKKSGPPFSLRILRQESDSFLRRLETGNLSPEEMRAGAKLLNDLLRADERRNRTMVRIFRGLGRLGVFVKNYETGESYPNVLWKALGYGPAEMEGDRWLKFVHPNDLERVRADLAQQFGGTQDVTQSARRIRDRFGEWRWILTKTLVLSRTDDGRPAWLMGADFDITMRVQSEQRARGARERAELKAREAESLLAAATVISSALEWDTAVQSVLDHAAKVIPNDVTLVALIFDGRVRILGGRDADGHLITPDDDAHELPGHTPFAWISEERRPLSINDISTVYPDYSEVGGVRVRSWLGLPLVSANSLIGAVVFARRTAGHYESDQIRLAVAFGEHLSVVLRNALEFREIRTQAMTDVLTRALTRRAFMESSSTELARCQSMGIPISLVMIDLDHFKRVNDEFGHEAGDRVLRRCAEVWHNELRERDLLGRIGGEEFAIALPRANRAVAVRIAERLRRCTREVKVGDGTRTMTASFGVATVAPTDPPITIDRLLGQADRNLYQAKHHGRDRVVADAAGAGARQHSELVK